MSDLISRLSEIRSNYNLFDALERPYYHALSEAIDMAKATQWIPCSERLPHDRERVIVQMINGYIGIIDFSAVGATKHLVAWMPLPEPYKEDKK